MTFRRADVRGKARCFLTRFLSLAVLSLVHPLAGAIAETYDGPPTKVASPVAPLEAARRITLPKGFHVSLFAAEPDVVQPIAMTIDPRGRLWVVENYSYPIWLGGPRGKDRIFWDKGTNLTGIELGFGGVWVCATPNLLFIADRDGDDRPDGEPVVMLDGWDTKAQHNMFNALRWGPDGWLWGCNGIMSNSRVGKPGTPADRRVAINCGVWRYHPTRQVFEAVAHGTTNPWGLDFDDLGEAFITNCVIPHLFHVVPGAHFQRMYGEDLEPFRYGLMETCADHIHWAGGRWTDSREGRGRHGEAGGGHAHVGAMIYLGDNWPDRYRNDVFTCNLHGRRINHDRLERRGSGYVARHEPDFLMANDPWFRGLEMKYGPDGAVYLTDWYDTGECHENDSDNAHRENGRIYKVGYGNTRPVKVDLSGQDDESLARLQLHHNDWYVRTARRLLQERAASGRDMKGVHRVLHEILTTNPDDTRKLRAIWALYATSGLDENAAGALLAHPSEHVRSWAVRLLVDSGPPSPATLARLAELAANDPSQKVRLSLASALQRLPIDRRWSIAEPLASHKEDASDAILPLMIWYGVERLVPADLPRALGWGAHCKIPLVRQFVTRRAVSTDSSAGLAAVVAQLQTAEDSACHDLLMGAHESLRGRKHVPRPEAWTAAFARLVARPDAAIVEQTLILALDFDEPKAIAILRGIAKNPSTPPEFRHRALSALVERRVAGLAPDLQVLLDEPIMRDQAIRALAAYDDPATPVAILRHYAKLSESERDDAITTLAARPPWALELLGAIGRGQVSRRDLNVTTARQLRALGDSRINDQLERVWGKVQPTSKEKVALVARYKALLAVDSDPPGDLSRGRGIFNRTCLACHRLYDAGGNVGPDLTGSDRATVDYILENVLDPSAAVSREYVLNNVATKDGRIISGIIREQTDSSIVIQTANERIILSREDLEAIKPSTSSMMPEGQLERLTPQEVRDLFAYLASTKQVPLPPESK
jgi:putative membrane-bound dehydrogenase-like protein